MSFPHDRWWARLFIAVDNRVRALRRNPFRAYVHPPAAMAAVAERLGFRRIRADRTFLWAIELYARDGA
jgi:hypothetical protein